MSEQKTDGPAPQATPAEAPVSETPAAPAAPEAPAPVKDRRRLFAGLRWTAAVLAFAATGTGVAYGLVQAERTELPGLSTVSDGRWVYPVLSRPELPAGAPLPQGPDNPRRIHYAPLDKLLLPAPQGAGPDQGLTPGQDGAVSADTFLTEYAPEDREKLKQRLENDGLRQIAARGWTMPDGTRTRLYLLRFHSDGFVDGFRGCETTTRLAGAGRLEGDTDWNKAETSQRSTLAGKGFQGSGILGNSDISVYQEAKPLGDEETRLGCLQAGDVQGVIVQTRKGAVRSVPFHQTVLLQSQLLS
ncbi:hypothetical protein [Streptomyces sp. NPDC051567]|uniref:hypothetical protein n=1 Tax=Streptomyces sp. NPDC051567 TaxID=3365660 RepID=UPI00379DFF86